MAFAEQDDQLPAMVALEDDLSQAFEAVLTRHNGLTYLEVLVALQNVQSTFLEEALAAEREEDKEDEE